MKTETNKINQELPYTSTNNITELNELIYAGAKLVCEKIGIPSKSTNEKSKQDRKFKADKNLRKQAQMKNQRKNAGIYWNKKEKATQKKNSNKTLGEINQKVLAKEGRLKRYRQRVKQYR